MKQQYLICELSSKDKLTVVKKVDADELKQIELNLYAASKAKLEFEKVRNAADKQWNYVENWNKMIADFESIFSINYYESIGFNGTIVIPYTKILQ